jgi:carboxyl-terminal processing protease
MKNLFLPIVIFVFAILLFRPELYSQSNTQAFEIAKNLDIYATLFKELNNNYVDEIQPGELNTVALNAMLKTLDPYTIYIPESKVEDMRYLTTGEYAGIGAGVIKRDGKVVIVSIQKGSPANEQGLMVGDEIKSIDNQDLNTKEDDEIELLLKGQPGTPTKLSILRYGSEVPIEKQVLRRKIDIDIIPYYGMLDSITGYISLASFTKNAASKTTKAFNDLKKENMKALIFDLRGNGGGLIGEAVDILNIFIDKDTEVVRIKSRVRDKNAIYRTRREAKDTQIPLVVLVDKNSASASEIVSGAIQDLDRGIVLGERTFGKGLVQNVIPLSFNSQMKVTVAKYYIPSGRCIQAIDYSHKDSDGKAHLVNDSLLEAFYTNNGRIVYDGRGIKPDLLLSPKDYAELTSNLIKQYLIFDFATEFSLKNDSILPSDQFEITDQLWNDFIDFVEENQFVYESELETKMEGMKKDLKTQGLFEELEAVCQALEEKITAKKQLGFSEHKKEIQQLLKTDIISRYYFDTGVIIANLNQDKAISEALVLINDSGKYQQVLQALNDSE